MLPRGHPRRSAAGTSAGLLRPAAYPTEFWSVYSPSRENRAGSGRLAATHRRTATERAGARDAARPSSAGPDADAVERTGRRSNAGYGAGARIGAKRRFAPRRAAGAPVGDAGTSDPVPGVPARHGAALRHGPQAPPRQQRNPTVLGALLRQSVSRASDRESSGGAHCSRAACGARSGIAPTDPADPRSALARTGRAAPSAATAWGAASHAGNARAGTGAARAAVSAAAGRRDSAANRQSRFTPGRSHRRRRCRRELAPAPSDATRR